MQVILVVGAIFLIVLIARLGRDPIEMVKGVGEFFWNFTKGLLIIIVIVFAISLLV